MKKFIEKIDWYRVLGGTILLASGGLVATAIAIIGCNIL